MILDACVFLGQSLYRNSLDVNRLLSSMQENGVDRAVVRPFKPCDYRYDRANRETAQIVSGHPMLTGFARVNPLERDAARQVERAVKEYGLKGLHLHPWEDNFIINAPYVYEVMDAVKELRVPVYVSAGYPNVSEPLQLLELMLRYPEVAAVATHAAQLDMSGMSFDDALETAAGCKNIAFDLSGVYRRDFIEKLIAAAGEDRVVFGSCCPYMDMGLELDRIRFTQIPDSQKVKIFGTNMARILGLEEQGA